MIDRIARQFQLLASQQKRLQKLQQTFQIGTPSSTSYLTTAKSLSMLTHTIAQTFTELLTPAQFRMLNKNYSSLVDGLMEKVSLCQAMIVKMKGEKQLTVNKSKNQNCSICGENIHESNIKQAKIGLEEQSKQNFHLAMEQFKKIAEEPIFTKEENNDFEERLHYLLSQREKVLNMNCNRIEEFAEIIESTLADLMKLKQIDAPILENQQVPDFITAHKISEDVSSFLQQSFSQKIPPWIHRTFLRMMTSYLHESAAKQTEKAIQTTPYQSIDSRDVRELFREKQSLQRENRGMVDQIGELRACNKRLQELYMENMKTIVGLNRNLRAKPTVVYEERERDREGQKSRRNSKNARYGRQDTPRTPRETAQDLQASQSIIDYSIYDEQNFKNSRNIVKRRKKKTILLPQIRKNRFQSKRQIKDKEDSDQNQNGDRVEEKSRDWKKASSKRIQGLENSVKEIRNQGSHERSKPNKQTTSKIQSKNPSTKAPNHSKTSAKTTKTPHPQNPSHKKTTSTTKQNQITRKQLPPQGQNPHPAGVGGGAIKKSKTTKLVKVNINKIENLTSGTLPVKSEEDSGIRELYQYVANIKLNRKDGDSLAEGKGEGRTASDEIEETAGAGLSHKRESSGVSDKENLEAYNRRINQKQLTIMKKISMDLTEQIKNKRQSLYTSIPGAASPQKQRILRKQASGEKKNLLQKKASTEISKQQRSGIEEAQGIDGGEGKGCQDDDYEQEYEDQEQNRMSQYIANQSKQPYEKLSKLRNSQNTYLLKRSKSKNLTNYTKNTQNRAQSLTSNIGSKQAQRKIFEILKNNHILQKSVDYNVFSSLIDKIDLKETQTAQHHEADPSRMAKYSKYDHTSSRKPSIVSETQQPIQQLANNSIYGRLFLSKALAYKYEQSTTKSYHKKILKPLTQAQLEYCSQMYGQLSETKKTNKEVYHEFCSILRYPFQTLYNNFQVVNFMEMSYDTFQYFFRKLMGIHRRCGSQGTGVCEHVRSVREELQNFIHQANDLTN